MTFSSSSARLNSAATAKFPRSPSSSLTRATTTCSSTTPTSPSHRAISSESWRTSRLQPADQNQDGKKAQPVGLVTALYRGRAHGTFPSQLEALGIATDFQAGVLLSKMIEGGLHYGLGSTLAVSRAALTEIGGLEPLADHLADDYELGARVDKAGYRVALSADAVETSVPAYAWRGFLDHQTRWARTVRDARPWGLRGPHFYSRPRLGAAQRDRQRSERAESLAARPELFSSSGASHDRRRSGPQRPPTFASTLDFTAARPHRHGRLGRWLRRRHHRLARRALPARQRPAD